MDPAEKKTALFGLTFQLICWLDNRHIRSAIPLMPALLIALLYYLLHSQHWADSCCEQPADSQLGEHARIGVSVATVLLGFATATILLMKQGIAPEERRKLILERLEVEVAGRLQLQFKGDEKTLLNDFVSASRQHLQKIWTCVDHLERFFHWMNIFGSMAIGVFALSMYMSFIFTSPKLWLASIHLFFTISVLAIFQLPLALVPALLDRHIATRLESDRIRKCYQEFRANFMKLDKIKLPSVD